jgi:hypothetical protein
MLCWCGLGVVSKTSPHPATITGARSSVRSRTQGF